MLDNDGEFYINMYNYYKNGYLPSIGGIYDQSSAFHSAIKLIESF